jgi:hypothetical protein
MDAHSWAVLDHLEIVRTYRVSLDSPRFDGVLHLGWEALSQCQAIRRALEKHTIEHGCGPASYLHSLQS